MKNRIKFTALILSFALICLFGSCKGSVNPENPANPDTPSDGKTYYTVTFDSDGGSTVASQKVESGKTPVIPANPTKSGYEFDGWFIEDAQYDFEAEITANITLKAKWCIVYTVIFDSTGGSSVTSQKVREGSTATVPAIPTKSGYDFLAWTLDDTPYAFTTKVTADITLKATWQTARYTVTFDPDNGDSEIFQTVISKETATRPAVTLAKDGYSFVDWYYDDSPFDFSTPITSDITIKAKWLDNNAIIALEVNVTPENIVRTIQTLTMSRTLKATGSFSTELISQINTALKQLNENQPSVLVRLDLSETTGLGYIEDLQAMRDYYGITGIQDEDKNKAFCECVNLETIVLPATVTSIGSCSFYGCTGLATLKLPSSVTSIGESAFLGCTGLEEVYYDGTKQQYSAISFGDLYSNTCIYNAVLNLGNTEETIIILPDTITTIDYELFKGFEKLKSITIPDSVTSIEGSAFEGCTSLTSITIPDIVTSIGGKAFYGCSSLSSITIPDSVTSLGDWAFEDCSNLKEVFYEGTLEKWCKIENSYPGWWDIDLYINNIKQSNITIPNSVTNIRRSIFWGCSSITNITIPSGITSIDFCAFAGCSSLTSITIPNGVTGISWGTFQCCTSLTSITIPDSVNSIGDNAFQCCTSLTSITIPDSVNSIGNNAFNDCPVLTSIIFENTTDWKAGDTPVSVDNPETNATYLTETYLGCTWTRSDN